jgi:hypothetical protein
LYVGVQLPPYPVDVGDTAAAADTAVLDAGPATAAGTTNAVAPTVTRMETAARRLDAFAHLGHRRVQEASMKCQKLPDERSNRVAVDRH